MKHIVFSLGCLLFANLLVAQQGHFVFIQETDRHPFYVRMEESSFSSSAGGHLILSSLKDSVYNMFIGFPKEKNAEQLFVIEVKGKDRGFELKNMNGQWQLFDLQALQMTKPTGSGGRAVEGVKKTDTYSELMAGVVGDTAVLYGPELIQQPVITKVDTVVQVAVKDSAVVQTPPAKPAKKAKKGAAVNAKPAPQESGPVVKQEVVVVPKKDSIVVAKADTVIVKKDSVMAVVTPLNIGGPVYDKRDIIRYGTENITEGKLMIYLDRSGPVTDTIRIIIPKP